VLFAVEKGADGRRRYVVCTQETLWKRYAPRLGAALRAPPPPRPPPPAVAAGRGGPHPTVVAAAPLPPPLPLHVDKGIPAGVTVELFFDMESRGQRAA